MISKYISSKYAELIGDLELSSVDHKYNDTDIAEQGREYEQNLSTIFSILPIRFVSGQFSDSAKSQRHSLRSTRRQANNCPFLVFLVDYFFNFSTLVTASGAQYASCRLSPRPRRSLRRNAIPTRQQVSPCSPHLGRLLSSPRPRHCRSAGSLSALR